MKIKFYLIFCIITTLSFIFCFFISSISTSALPWSTDMWEQPSIKPYEEAREYPENSVFANDNPRELSREEYEVIQNGPNNGEESISRGKILYETYCYACHGTKGMGDGPIIKNDLRPKSYFYPVNLTQSQTQNRTDGYIYAYVRYGGKVMMPAYARVTGEEAWDIVYYVRFLQGKVK